MPLDGRPAFVGELDLGVGPFPDKVLVHFHQAAVGQFGEVAGEVAGRQPRQALQKKKVGALAG